MIDTVYVKNTMCAVSFIILSCFHSERELVMDLERLKLAKSVKPKKSRDKVYSGLLFTFTKKSLFDCKDCRGNP